MPPQYFVEKKSFCFSFLNKIFIFDNYFKLNILKIKNHSQ